MKKFLQIESANDEEGIEELLELGGLDYADMGRVLHTFRAWPGPWFWVPFGLLWLAVAYSTVDSPSLDDAMFEAASLGGNLLFWNGILLAAYGLERHRVCEHGLVVGFRKRSKYVIPWATLDPGRVRVARRMGLLGRRPDVPQMSPRYRVGVFALHGIVLNGLDSAVMSPFAELDPNPVRSPFAWWMLATRRAPELLAAIEAAMVADGYRLRGWRSGRRLRRSR